MLDQIIGNILYFLFVIILGCILLFIIVMCLFAVGFLICRFIIRFLHYRDYIKRRFYKKDTPYFQGHAGTTVSIEHICSCINKKEKK